MLVIDEHEYPSSTKHEESHPSPSIRFPSSHSSVRCLTPSPHCTSHAVLAELGESPSVHSDHESWTDDVPPVQMNILSIVQAELHPS